MRKCEDCGEMYLSNDVETCAECRGDNMIEVSALEFYDDHGWDFGY